MLGQKSHKYIAASLAALVLLSAYGNSAAAEEMDRFGIEKIYPTKQGGNEWFVDMNNPTGDLKNIGNVAFAKNSDGSWHVFANQIRMEAWSPANEKWHNVEITMYAKMDGSTSASDLLQMYSRGGHHSSKDPCSGSAYKARLYEDGRAAWTKEVTHPAYATNRDVEQVTGSIGGKWIGFKAVIYNVVKDGQTYVRLESYIDDDVTEANGNLVVKNNWKLASVVEDRGGWATPDSDFASYCGVARDAILTGPGGSGSQNIVAWRSDNIGWSFKYLSAREINPDAPVVDEEPRAETPTNNTDTDNEPALGEYELVAGQHVPNDGGSATIASIDLEVRKLTTRSEGKIAVAIVQNDTILASSASVDTDAIGDKGYHEVTAMFEKGVTVEDNYDIVVMYSGSGGVGAAKTEHTKPGNYFDFEEEWPRLDLLYEIH